MVKYPTVDLRPRLAGGPIAPQGTVGRKTSVTWHYNGPPVYKRDVDQLLFDAEFHTSKDWGGGARTRGIQYEWAVGSDGTKYRLRNPRSILWHCAHPTGNAYSYSCTFLIGEGQRITAAAREGAAELTDELRSADGIARDDVYGHQEWSATACPGSAQADFVLPYRQGRLASTPPEKSETWELAKYNFVSGSEDWGDPRCKDAVAMVNEAAGKTLARWTGKKERAVYASQKAYESPAPAGKLVAIAVGEKAVGKLSTQAKSVFGKYDKGESDIWDARYTEELWECLRTIAVREKLKGLPAKWDKKYGGKPEGDSGKGEGPLTLNQLMALYQTMPASYYISRFDGLNKAMQDGKINTYRRLCYFLANVGHESGGLKYVEEIASGAAYEWRRDLGNVYAGDGVRFKGRGYIQLTGRANYTAFSKAMGVDFVGNPEKVEEPYWAAMSAVWFWNMRGLSTSADAGDWATVCLKINGRWPANGQADRDMYLARCQNVLG